MNPTKIPYVREEDYIAYYKREKYRIKNDQLFNNNSKKIKEQKIKVKPLIFTEK